MALPNSRVIFWILVLGTASLMAIALYMQYAMGLEPCPMCILQRIMVITAGTIALIAALHNPGEAGIKIYGGLVCVAALIGAGISLRHLWLQSLPPDQVPACGPGLDYLLDVFPLTEVLAMVLRGDGSCAEVVWSLFGISIPGWALIGFAGLLVVGVVQVVHPRPPLAR
jgi:disulfide bond formation protein DsbB